MQKKKLEKITLSVIKCKTGKNTIEQRKMRDDYVFISLITFMKFVPPKNTNTVMAKERHTLATTSHYRRRHHHHQYQHHYHHYYYYYYHHQL